MEKVFKEIKQERERQDELWGEQNHEPAVWSAILTEEIGEVAKAVLDLHFDTTDNPNLREELVQVAAVAVAFIECLDRKEKEII